MIPPSHLSSETTNPSEARAPRSNSNPLLPRAAERALWALLGISRLVLSALVSIVFLVLHPSWDMLHRYAPVAHTTVLS
jgi:hypothetical protein